MPEQKNRQTVPPDTTTAGGTGEQHPVLDDVAEAGRMVADAAGYLSPTRDFDVPHLEAGDWPADLDPAETLAMLRQLAAITHDVSGCLTGIASQHAVPGAAKPELDALADLLTHAGSTLTALTGTPQQAAPAAGGPRGASQDFPHPPAARTTGDARPPARPAAPPSARPRMTP
jgi:hypothetical protein